MHLRRGVGQDQGYDGVSIPKRQVVGVLERDDFVCVLQLPGCLWDASCFDHRSNRGIGGSKVLNGMSAGVAACGICNGNKEDSTGEEREELKRRGLIVAKAATHAATAARLRLTPVLYPDGNEYWLTDDGRRVPVGPWQPF